MCRLCPSITEYQQLPTQNSLYNYPIDRQNWTKEYFTNLCRMTLIIFSSEDAKDMQIIYQFKFI